MTIKEDALTFIDDYGSVPLPELLEYLGCQCGRPKIQDISYVVSRMLSSKEIILSPDRKVKRPST